MFGESFAFSLYASKTQRSNNHHQGIHIAHSMQSDRMKKHTRAASNIVPPANSLDNVLCIYTTYIYAAVDIHNMWFSCANVCSGKCMGIRWKGGKCEFRSSAWVKVVPITVSRGNNDLIIEFGCEFN